MHFLSSNFLTVQLGIITIYFTDCYEDNEIILVAWNMAHRQ